jgi:hypothetical protein
VLPLPMVRISAPRPSPVAWRRPKPRRITRKLRGERGCETLQRFDRPLPCAAMSLREADPSDRQRPRRSARLGDGYHLAPAAHGDVRAVNLKLRARGVEPKGSKRSHQKTTSKERQALLRMARTEAADIAHRQPFRARVATDRIGRDRRTDFLCVAFILPVICRRLHGSGSPA